MGLGIYRLFLIFFNFLFFFFSSSGRCHTVAIGKTQCSSHQECALPDTECGYVDAYLQPSFGNVPCAACTARPICLVSGSSGSSSSYCVCMLRAVSSQTCTTPGQRITPNPTQLCLASLGSSSISSSSSYTASWSTLVAAQCAVLNQAQTYCIAVYDTNSVATPLAVGLALLYTGGTNRRLLGGDSRSLLVAQNTSEWERFAVEPCLSLMRIILHGPANKADHLGPVDLYTASECQRWWDIGERAVVRFNLTRVPPVAFTAWPVLMDIMLTDPLAARELGKAAPRLLPFLASFQSWVQPAVLAAAHYYQSFAVIIRNRTRLANNYTSNNDTVIIITPELLELMPLGRRGGNYNHNPKRRTLLQSSDGFDSWKDNLAAVQDYTVSILSSKDGAAVNIAPDFAAQWSQGPFLWPPSYDYNTAASSALPPCLIGALLFNLTLQTFVSTVSFYTGSGAPPRPAVYRTFAECMPPLPFRNQNPIRIASASDIDTSSANAALKSIEAAFLDRDAIQAYLTRQQGRTESQFSLDVRTFVSCDFDAVQHCTSFTRDLLWGTLILAVACCATSYVARAVFGIPFVEWLAAALFVPLLGVFVFGVSPLCTPMIPTCFLEELTHALEYLLPVSIAWPDQLQHWPGCASGVAATDMSVAWRADPGTSACFRSCTSDWPFQFSGAADSAVWIFLRLGIPEIANPIPALPPGILAQIGSFLFFFLDPSSSASLTATVKAPYLQWPDMAAAQDVCCALTAFNLIPPILSLLILLSFLVTIAATLPVLLAEFVISVAAAALAFTHTSSSQSPEDEEDDAIPLD
jgi:hypothetical protein